MDVTLLPDARPRARDLAVGEFDGVHIGHREVIRGADTVLTFEPHPRAVVAPESAPKLLTTLEIKADLVAALGVRELVVIPFDGSFAAQSPEAFIEHELVARADMVVDLHSGGSSLMYVPSALITLNDDNPARHAELKAALKAFGSPVAYVGHASPGQGALRTTSGAASPAFSAAMPSASAMARSAASFSAWRACRN